MNRNVTWNLTLDLNDGRVVSDRFRTPTSCPCSHCWCGKTGTAATVKSVFEQLLLTMNVTYDLEEPDPVTPAASSTLSPTSVPRVPAKKVKPLLEETPVLKLDSMFKALARKRLSFRRYLANYRRSHSTVASVRSTTSNTVASVDLQTSVAVPTTSSNSMLQVAVPSASASVVDVDNLQASAVYELPTASGNPMNQIEVLSTSASSEDAIDWNDSASRVHDPAGEVQEHLNSSMDSQFSFRANVAHYYKNRKRRPVTTFFNSSHSSTSSLCLYRPPVTRKKEGNNSGSQENQIRKEQRPPTPLVGERIYECDECSKTYFQRLNLNLHKLRTHQGLEKFQCEECSRSFPSRRGLNNHSRVHQKPAPGPSVIEDSHFGSVEPVDRDEQGQVVVGLQEPEVITIDDDQPEDVPGDLLSAPEAHDQTETPPAGPSSSARRKETPLSETENARSSDGQISLQTENRQFQGVTSNVALPESRSGLSTGTLSSDSELPIRSILGESGAVNQASGDNLLIFNVSSLSCSAHFHHSNICNHGPSNATGSTEKDFAEDFSILGTRCNKCLRVFKEQAELFHHKAIAHPTSSVPPNPPTAYRPAREEWNTRERIQVDLMSNENRDPLIPQQHPASSSQRQPDFRQIPTLPGGSFCQWPQYIPFDLPSNNQPSFQPSRPPPNPSLSRSYGYNHPNALMPPPPPPGKFGDTTRKRQKRVFYCNTCPARMDRRKKMEEHKRRNHGGTLNGSTSGNVSMDRSWRS